MSLSELPGSWSAAADRAAGTASDPDACPRPPGPCGGGVVRAAGPPPRYGSSESAAAAVSRRHPIGSGTGGSGSPGDADDALLAAAAAPSPSPGLTAEMALSILVDCFGH